MDTRFAPDNSHLQDSKRFSETDSDLRALTSYKYVYHFTLLDQFPMDQPGVYTFAGAHQTGKTTLLKTWIAKLLTTDILPNAIGYFSCDKFTDYHDMQRFLQKYLAAQPAEKILYIILDEVTAIRSWEKAIQFLINEKRIVLMIAGTDTTLAEQVQKHFSREMTTQHDFHLYPLSFREVVLLKQGNEPKASTLYEEFNQYLIHGGFLKAINDVVMHGHILDATLSSYTDWLCKFTVAHNKQERFLREILSALTKHFNSQLTWNALVQELSIDHPKTIGDYLEFLEALDIVFIQYALLEDSLKPAPKKARKIIFTDPFIYHAIHAWLSGIKKNIAEEIKATLSNPELSSKLVETCVITQFRRYYPTYYIKAEGEVDLAYVHNQRFWPIEITWQNQMRSKDLKQILKYANGKILTKTERSGIIQHIKTESLPITLWHLEDTHVK